MKKLLFSLLATLMFVTSGCKYDDTDIWNSVNGLEQRVATLEELCKQMNTNITSLQTIVNAINNNDYITKVTPLYEGGVQIGYTIEFAKSPSITIYHGKDGQNGADGKDGKDGKSGQTPTVGVRQDADGHYYWTLDGDWLLDENGQKVSAEGSVGIQGQDGVTPIFKIENEGWYLSLDNGETWIYLGKAVDSDGQGGSNGNNGDSMFSSIDTTNAEYVIFTLADGTVFKVPRVADLSIEFEGEYLEAMRPNSTREIPYSISGNTSNLQVEVLSSGNVRAKVSDTTSASGILTVTTGATIDEYDKVVMLVSNGQNTIMRSIIFEEAGLRVKGDLTYEVEAEGGTIQINIETNSGYTVSIPDDTKSWISQVVPSRAWRNETITLKVEANESVVRNATIRIVNSEDYTFCTITLKQLSKNNDGNIEIPEDMAIAFPDEIFRNYVLDNFDLDRDGKISQEEAKKVTEIILTEANVKSMVGLQYFVNLGTLWAYANELTNLDVSQNTVLTELKCNLNQLSNLDVTKNTALITLDCSFNELTSLDVSKNKSLEELYCSSNHKIGNLDVSQNILLTVLECGSNGLTSLDVSKNKELTILDCNYNTFLTNLDVSQSRKLSILSLNGNRLRDLDISQNTALTYLNCSRNWLLKLDVSQNTTLKTIYCADNELAILDLSKNLEVELLNCNNNTMGTLILKAGHSIEGITESRNDFLINPRTEIIFVD